MDSITVVEVWAPGGVVNAQCAYPSHEEARDGLREAGFEEPRHGASTWRKRGQHSSGDYVLYAELKRVPFGSFSFGR